MPVFTIETAYKLPVYRQRTYEAASIEQACQLAIGDQGWEDGQEDVDSSGDTYVAGVWAGADAAFVGPALAIPAAFEELIQRKADHFEVLLGLLKLFAHASDSTAPQLAAWRARAEEAIAKAEAILGAATGSATGDRA